MAFTALTVQEITPAGVTPALVAAPAAPAEGVSIPGDGNTYIEVNNAGASMTVTIQTPAKVGGLDVAENTITIASGVRKIGPFARGVYNQADGLVHITYSRDTSVTIGAFKFA